MHRPGHLGASLLAYAPVAFVLVAGAFEFLLLLGGAIAVGGCMLPDYDQRIPFVSHRGITHTVYFVGLVGGVAALAGLAIGGAGGGLAGALGTALVAGVVGTLTVGSHVLADMLTPAGVEPFADGRRMTYDLVRADNPVANYALLGVGLAVLAGALLAGRAVGGFL